MTTRELIETFTREEGIALFNEKKTDKEIYDLLVLKGLTDSFDTFKAESEKIFTEKVSGMSKEEILTQIEGAELTDEQLEQIAGGKDENQAYEGKVIGIGVAGGAVGLGVTIAGAVILTGSATAAAAF